MPKELEDLVGHLNVSNLETKHHPIWQYRYWCLIISNVGQTFLMQIQAQGIVGHKRLVQMKSAVVNKLKVLERITTTKPRI